MKELKMRLDKDEYGDEVSRSLQIDNSNKKGNLYSDIKLQT